MNRLSEEKPQLEDQDMEGRISAEQDYDAAALTDAAGIDCHLWEDGGCCFSCVCAVYEDCFGEGSSRKAADDLEVEYVAAGISRHDRQLLATLVLYGVRRKMLEKLASSKLNLSERKWR